MTSSLIEPLWLTIDDILAIHAEQILLRGGPEGIRNYGLVESALHRPMQLFLYDGEGDLLTLAVRLGIGVAENHGFVDGNKRHWRLRDDRISRFERRVARHAKRLSFGETIPFDARQANDRARSRRSAL